MLRRSIIASTLAAALAFLWLPAAAAASPAKQVVPAAKKKADNKKGKADETKKDEKKDPMSAPTFRGLALRGIGPALTSGRVIDLAVDPTDESTYFVAAASGGVWKTTDHGTTFEPVFENEGSYSVGCVTIDPSNPLVVWVGSGENNSQRSVGYGDGVYKSVDGGKSWKNMGLKNSEHIGMIKVHPEDSDVVYVAAQGPLWSAGGDRGLYRTTDGGETWKKVLEISDDTGVSEVLIDPENPDTLYAVAYQRRRRVWTLINGGPESGLHKSTDGGETWHAINSGLPKVELGRIGIAMSQQDPNVLYAVVEAQNDAGGFFRSSDGGESWERRSKYVTGSPQYYQEIFTDPNVFDRIYAMDTIFQVSDDGGRSFRPVGQENMHVDHHALWIDPDDSTHLITGNDGGLYESYNGGGSWNFKPNLPITQFYRVSVDQEEPFYNVYGGTQDNFSLGGPARTTSSNGITNADWFITNGGDGFETQVDPEDSNIVYAQSQYGGLTRFDRASGESLDIQPQPTEPGEALRWNWDSPLLISPHSHTRIYFASNRLYRSDDRGNSWTVVSPDLTRQIDRNQLEVMGRVWGVDTVAKNASTSFYGNIVSLTESPLQEGLLYVGTDDGLIQVSADGGQNWRKIESFPGVPNGTYVVRLEASMNDADTVFAAFNAHKDGDFKPYLLRSNDRGASWTSIAGDLPERGSVYAVMQDHVDPDLLFAGTEFGVFFSKNGGGTWIPLTGGLPTIAIRDIDIQRRENDLVLASFGRGFYVLDDYSPLRSVDAGLLEKKAHIFPVRDSLAFIEETRIGVEGKGFQGDSFFNAPNPPYGAVFTYYLKESPKTRKAMRQEAEKEALDAEESLAYPTWDALRMEDRELEPQLLFTITDESGEVVRRLTAPPRPGLQRIAWNLRFPSTMPTRLAPPPSNPFFSLPDGPMVVPGTYNVSMAMWTDDGVEELVGPTPFEVEALGNATLPAQDRASLLAFQQKTARLQRAVSGAIGALGEAQERLQFLQRAHLDTPTADPALRSKMRELELRFADIEEKLTGDRTIGARNEATPPSIAQWVQRIVFGHSTSSTSAATGTHQQSYENAAEAFAPVLAELTRLIQGDLAEVEQRMEAAGAPWTPGRLPVWQPE